MQTLRLIAPGFALLSASAPLGAQTPPTDPLYHVEIVVFAWATPTPTRKISVTAARTCRRRLHPDATRCPLSASKPCPASKPNSPR
jgi:hypothetical protein